MKNYRCLGCGEDMREGKDIYDQTYWYCMNIACTFESYNAYMLKLEEEKKEEQGGF